MGAGIAFVAAQAGYAVDLIEPDPAAQDRAKQRIVKEAARANAPDAPAQVNYYAAVQAGTQAVLAIEAVPEQLDLKHQVFAALAATLGPQTLLATNTSSLSVNEIAEGVDRPERVLGLHFFNPPSAMKLVEIVYAESTSDETLAQARAIVERLGKTAVLAADTPGFIVNRIARPYYLQAMRAYDAGVAPMDEIDRLARGAGFRMGPFELMDLIGNDVNLATSQSVYERTGAARLEPVQLQRDLVAQNRLGRKTGAGFYDYSTGAPEHDDALPQAATEPDASEKIVVLGYAGLALEMQQLLGAHYANVQTWENEDTVDEIALDTTIVFDVGDGVTDRGAIVETLDSVLPPESVIFVDAYSTDLQQLAKRVTHPERIVGYGILASLENQNVVEIVDSDQTGDDALELAQELFESIGRRVALVEDRAGLCLGRIIGSIVNEAVYVVDEQIATAEDVDTAMRLGTNYPRGPIEWGRQIGGDRIVRILQRLAGKEGAAFAPHRALWVLDVQDEEQTMATAVAEGAVE
jgi:3-hydroxybutyryl-CoA dehydrogenase